MTVERVRDGEEKGKQFFTSRCWWHRKHFHPFLFYSLSASLFVFLPSSLPHTPTLQFPFGLPPFRMYVEHARVTSRRCAFCCFVVSFLFTTHNFYLLSSRSASSYLVLCLLLKGGKKSFAGALVETEKMLMTGLKRPPPKKERKLEEDTFWLNFVACGCSIALLILVMPSIEVNVEYDDGARCQAGE